MSLEMNTESNSDASENISEEELKKGWIDIYNKLETKLPKEAFQLIEKIQSFFKETSPEDFFNELASKRSSSPWQSDNKTKDRKFTSMETEQVSSSGFFIGVLPFSRLRLAPHIDLNKGEVTENLKQVQLKLSSPALNQDELFQVTSLIDNYLTLRYREERYGQLRVLDKVLKLKPSMVNHVVLMEQSVSAKKTQRDMERLQEQDSSWKGEVKEDGADQQKNQQESGSRISLAHLFDRRLKQRRERDSNTQEFFTPRRICLQGGAGFGKSTLCQQICREWALGHLWRDKFDWVIWLPLRELNHDIQDCKARLGDVLNALVFSPSGGTGDCSAETLHQLWQSPLQERILFILDGYDEFEVRSSPYKRVIEDLLSGSHKGSLILTARPFHLETHPFDVKIDLREFDLEAMDDYIETFFEDEKEAEKKIEQVKLWLRQSSQATHLASVPILLGLLCYLWNIPKYESLLRKQPSFSLTALYTHLTDCLWERYVERDGPAPVKGKNSSETLETLKLFNAQKTCLRQFFEKLAFYMTEHNQLLVDVDTLCQIGFPIFKAFFSLNKPNDLKSYLETLLNPGFLAKYGQGHKTQESYFFIHKTFQEYFAACFLVETFLNNASFLSWQSDKQAALNTTTTELIQRYKFHPRYEMLWYFMSGLLKQHQDTAQDTKPLSSFFECITQAPHDLFYDYEILLLTGCLNEAEVSQHIPQADFILKSFCGWLMSSLKNLSSTSRQTQSVLRFNPPIFKQDAVQKVLLQMLQAHDTPEQTLVLQVLEGQTFLSPAMVSKLLNIAKTHDHRFERNQSMRVLSYVASLNKSLLEAFFEFTQNESPSPFVELFTLLSLHHPEDVFPALFKILEWPEKLISKKYPIQLIDDSGQIVRESTNEATPYDEHQGLKSHVLAVIGKIAKKQPAWITRYQFVTELLPYAKGQDTYLQAEAIKALGNCRNTDDEILLLLQASMQNTADISVRRHAITALRKLVLQRNDDKWKERLAQALTTLIDQEENPELVMHAAKALMKLGQLTPEVNQHLLEKMLKDKKAWREVWRDYFQVVQTSQQYNDEMIKQCISLLLRPPFKESDEIIKFFNGVNFNFSNHNTSFVSKLLQHQDFEMKWRGWKIIRLSSFPKVEFFNTVIQRLEDSDERIREEAIKTFATLSSEHSSAHLMKKLNKLALNDASWRVQEKAVQLMSTLSVISPETIQTLLTLVKHPNFRISSAAADTLGSYVKNGQLAPEFSVPTQKALFNMLDKPELESLMTIDFSGFSAEKALEQFSVPELLQTEHPHAVNAIVKKLKQSRRAVYLEKQQLFYYEKNDLQTPSVSSACEALLRKAFAAQVPREWQILIYQTAKELKEDLITSVSKKHSTISPSLNEGKAEAQIDLSKTSAFEANQSPQIVSIKTSIKKQTKSDFFIPDIPTEIVYPPCSFEAFITHWESHWPKEFRELLQKEDTKGCVDFISKRQKEGQLPDTAIYWLMLAAAYEGTVEQVTALVKEACVNVLTGSEEEKLTVMHAAALKGDMSLVKTARGLKFGLNKPARFGAYANVLPIHCAIVGGHVDLFTLLKEKIPFSHLHYQFGPEKLDFIELGWLSLAVYAKQFPVVQKLLGENIEVLSQISYIQGGWGGNVLHLAVEMFQQEMLALLLSHDYFRTSTYIEGTNTEGLTPFALAAKLGNISAMKTLKEKGAKLDGAVQSGVFKDYRPLHLAVESGIVSVVERLLQWGAKTTTSCLDTQNQSSKERTAQQLAKKRSQQAMTESKKATSVDLRRELTRKAMAYTAIETTLTEFDTSQELTKFKATTAEKVIYKNMVFKGGGPKGIVYVGALVKLLEKWQQHDEMKDLNSIERVGGTSAGAITAALLAVGYEPKHMQELLLKPENSPKQFLEGKSLDVLSTKPWMEKAKSIAKGVLTHLQPMQLGSLLINLYREESLCTGDVFLKWIEGHLRTATGIEWCTFGELKQLIDKQTQGTSRFRHLHVVTIRVNPTTTIEVISSEDERYRDYSIAHAIRASMSVPFIFKPAQLYRVVRDEVTKVGTPVLAHDGHYIDGGLLANYPLELFDEAKYVYQGLYTFRDGKEKRFPVYNEATLGFSIQPEKPLDNAALKQPGKLNLLAALKSLYSNAEEHLHQLHQSSRRTVTIGNGNVSLFDFDLTPTQLQALLKEGESAVQGVTLLEAEAPSLNYFFNELKDPSAVSHPKLPELSEKLDGSDNTSGGEQNLEDNAQILPNKLTKIMNPSLSEPEKIQPLEAFFTELRQTSEKITNETIKTFLTEKLALLQKQIEDLWQGLQDPVLAESSAKQFRNILSLIENKRTEIKDGTGEDSSKGRADDILAHLKSFLTKHPDILSSISSKPPLASKQEQPLPRAENRLWHEQQLVSLDSFQAPFHSLLNQIQKKAIAKCTIPQHVVLCYALPDMAQAEEQHLDWFERFLNVLEGHLKQAGIFNTCLLFKNQSLHDALKLTEKASCVLAIGTESFLKASKEFTSPLSKVLAEIDRQRDLNHGKENYKLIGLLVSGERKTSFPAHYDATISILDFTKESYVQNLWCLITKLYTASDNMFQSEWNAFLEKTGESALVFKEGLHLSIVQEKAEKDLIEKKEHEAQHQALSRKLLHQMESVKNTPFLAAKKQNQMPPAEKVSSHNEATKIKEEKEVEDERRAIKKESAASPDLEKPPVRTNNSSTFFAEQTKKPSEQGYFGTKQTIGKITAKKDVNVTQHSENAKSTIQTIDEIESKEGGVQTTQKQVTKSTDLMSTPLEKFNLDSKVLIEQLETLGLEFKLNKKKPWISLDANDASEKTAQKLLAQCLKLIQADFSNIISHDEIVSNEWLHTLRMETVSTKDSEELLKFLQETILFGTPIKRAAPGLKQ